MVTSMQRRLLTALCTLCLTLQPYAVAQSLGSGGYGIDEGVYGSYDGGLYGEVESPSGTAPPPQTAPPPAPSLSPSPATVPTPSTPPVVFPSPSLAPVPAPSPGPTPGPAPAPSGGVPDGSATADVLDLFTNVLEENGGSELNAVRTPAVDTILQDVGTTLCNSDPAIDGTSFTNGICPGSPFGAGGNGENGRGINLAVVRVDTGLEGPLPSGFEASDLLGPITDAATRTVLAVAEDGRIPATFGVALTEPCARFGGNVQLLVASCATSDVLRPPSQIKNAVFLGLEDAQGPEFPTDRELTLLGELLPTALDDALEVAVAPICDGTMPSEMGSTAPFEEACSSVGLELQAVEAANVLPFSPEEDFLDVRDFPGAIVTAPIAPRFDVEPAAAVTGEIVGGIVAGVQGDGRPVAALGVAFNGRPFVVSPGIQVDFRCTAFDNTTLLSVIACA